MMKYYRIKNFSLENGGVFPDLRIAYHSFGQLNKKRNNVVWVCHALTANSNVPEWWPDIAGPHALFDPKDYFIVCANMIGSPYGSTSPLDINSSTGNPYYHDFPLVTIRDISRAHHLLRKHLGIEKVFACIGGSCGGHQALEFAILQPGIVQYLFPVVTSARETAWSIAIHTAQRMAIEADGSWKEKNPDAGIDGMKTARGIGLLSYRSYDAYIAAQTEEDDHKLDFLKASSYIRYQGKKLADRFNAFSYYHMTKTLDTHHLGRARKSIIASLKSIQSKTLVVGIASDQLIPFVEQEYLANHIPSAELLKIESIYGHDGFLINQQEIAKEIGQFISDTE